MNTVYTVLGMITFWAIVVYLAYEYVWPYLFAATEAVRFLRWYDREAKRANPNHTYKEEAGLAVRYAYAYGNMLGRIREQRAGMTVEITHHSGATFK